MPELPEVETIRCQLAAVLAGRRFAGVGRLEPFMLRDTTPEELARKLPGRRIELVARTGKFLVLRLSGDYVLTIHLGMTGQLLTGAAILASSPHDRFVFAFSGGEGLVFRDVRKLGRLQLTRGRLPERLQALGPDALTGSWDAVYLAERLHGRRAPLKAFLLDQRNLAGIGNIYADEILFAARLSPLRPAGGLDEQETVRLAAEIRARLGEGVRLRGCSISDFVDLEGSPGSFQEELRVYGRSGEQCVRCGDTVVRCLVAGRGTSYCAQCQR